MKSQPEGRTASQLCSLPFAGIGLISKVRLRKTSLKSERCPDNKQKNKKYNETRMERQRDNSKVLYCNIYLGKNCYTETCDNCDLDFHHYKEVNSRKTGPSQSLEKLGQIIGTAKEPKKKRISGYFYFIFFLPVRDIVPTGNNILVCA